MLAAAYSRTAIKAGAWIDRNATSISIQCAQKINSRSPATNRVRRTASYGLIPSVMRPSGYGHDIVAGMSRVRVLVSLKTRRVEGAMHVKCIEVECLPVGVIWKLGERGAVQNDEVRRR
ncbi:hypothetical protein TNCV_4416301 [Trichonephila clavipes]|uniref:Uncharacterized protein n=1 Tax=Trichonephila clavipes TaxID=2585209 RepID=A0A8X6S4L4_TRICX|nr:hypothetical protein TNCV_4416301 [Trichonephila clavipes]